MVSIADPDSLEKTNFSSLLGIESQILGRIAYRVVTVLTTFLLCRISAGQAIYYNVTMGRFRAAIVAV
jgi:uncharacterized membrane protein